MQSHLRKEEELYITFIVHHSHDLSSTCNHRGLIGLLIFSCCFHGSVLLVGQHGLIDFLQ